MNKKRISFFLLAVCLALLSSCTSNKLSIYKKSRPLMDTLVSVTVVSDSDDKAAKAIESAFSVMDRFGKLINFFSGDSELSSINRNAGIRGVTVSPEMIDVIEKAVYVAEKSDGAFDITIGPESGLWDFYKKVKPSDDEIRKNLDLVDYRDIVIDKEKSMVFLRRKGMLMDLGGIAKGYAADLAVENLKQNGIRAGIVANAGDIRVFGVRPDGSPWNIGVKNPRQKDESDELIARIKLSDKAISTSGDYERYFITGGKRFHHILDPKTGYPASYCRSVTIIADKGVFTDGFSTAVFVLGPEKGMKLVRETGMDAVIIDSNGTIYTTPGMEGILTIEENH